MPRKPKRAARGGGGKHSYTPPEWRFSGLITMLGSPAEIVAKIEARGYPRIPRTSINGWWHRNSIPPFWVPLFIQMALDENLISKIEDLRVQQE